MSEAEAPAGEETRGGALRRVSANTAAQGVADVAAKLAVLLTYAVVARELGTVAVGELTFAISLSVLVVIAGLGMDPLVGREVARDPGNTRDLLWHVLGLKLMLAVVAVVPIVLVALIGEYTPALRLTLLLIALSATIDLLAGTLAWILRGRERMVPVGIGQVIQRFTLTLIAVGTLLLLGAGVVAVGVAYVVGSVVGAGYLVIQLVRHGLWSAPTFSPRRATEVAVESLPLAAGTILSTALARLDAILLTAMTTFAVVGIYGAAYRLIEGTFFVGWALGAALFPMLSRLDANSTPSLDRVFSIGARVCLAGTFPAGAVFILFPTPLIHLVYGAEFSSAIDATRWLGIVAGVNGLASFGVFALLARDLKGSIVRVCAAALLVNLVVNLILIPPLGATGAAIAMAAANIVLTASATAIAAREIGSLSAVRTMGLTAFAFGLMALSWLLLGETWLGMLVGLVAYAAGLAVGHHFLFGSDTQLVREWLRARRAGPEQPVVPGV